MNDAPAAAAVAVAVAHAIEVPRSARYYTLGDAAAAREGWVVLHGYGQLAEYFVRHFAPVADGRLIVAPEALSRFYVGREGGGRVGATWMTREDRLAEIADYVRYLDRVHEAAGGGALGAAWGVLGFSQGATTAARWVAARHARGLPGPARLVLWGGTLPHDLAAAGWEALRATRVTVVVGDADEFATAEVVAREEERLRGEGVEYELVRYAGGHRIEAGGLAGVFR